MDPVQTRSESDEGEEAAAPRQLPPDLPKSLDDRQPVRSFGGETEMYDAWQGRVRASQNSLSLECFRCFNGRLMRG